MAYCSMYSTRSVKEFLECCHSNVKGTPSIRLPKPVRKLGVSGIRPEGIAEDPDDVVNMEGVLPPLTAAVDEEELLVVVLVGRF